MVDLEKQHSADPLKKLCQTCHQSSDLRVTLKGLNHEISAWLKLDKNLIKMDALTLNIIYSDLLPVEKEVSIEIDLEVVPLIIRTDSEIGSGDLVDVDFADVVVYSAGGVLIHFNDQIEYELKYCTDTKNTLTNVPTDKHKEWTIYRTQDSVKIECNGVEVLDYRISSCTNGMKGVYDKDITKVFFKTPDTASDLYRARNGKLCNYRFKADTLKSIILLHRQKFVPNVFKM